VIVDGYATLAEFREYVSEDPTQNDHDSNFEYVIEAASRAVDLYCGFPPGRFGLDEVATARTFYARDPYQLMVDPIGSLTGAVVKTGTGDGTFGTTLTLTTDYIFEPLNALADGEAITRIRLSGGQRWPVSTYGTPQVQVTALWGWPAVPAPVRQATMQAAAELWFRRNAPAGFVQTVDFGPIRLTKDAMASVSSLLNPYQRGTTAVALV
jgi:hypothetical protein